MHLWAESHNYLMDDSRGLGNNGKLHVVNEICSCETYILHMNKDVSHNLDFRPEREIRFPRAYNMGKAGKISGAYEGPIPLVKEAPLRRVGFAGEATLPPLISYPPKTNMARENHHV